MFSISFNYRESTYEALIRVIKEKGDRREYRITVMNGELEVLLFGHHMLVEENGQLNSLTKGLSDEAAELKTIIAEAFSAFKAEVSAN